MNFKTKKTFLVAAIAGSAIFMSGCTSIATSFANRVYNTGKSGHYYSKYKPSVNTKKDLNDYINLGTQVQGKIVQDEDGFYFFKRYKKDNGLFKIDYMTNIFAKNKKLLKSLRNSTVIVAPVYKLRPGKNNTIELYTDWEDTKVIYKALSQTIKVKPFSLTKKFDKDLRNTINKKLTDQFIEGKQEYRSLTGWIPDFAFYHKEFTSMMHKYKNKATYVVSISNSYINAYVQLLEANVEDKVYENLNKAYNKTYPSRKNNTTFEKVVSQMNSIYKANLRYYSSIHMQFMPTNYPQDIGRFSMAAFTGYTPIYINVFDVDLESKHFDIFLKNASPYEESSKIQTLSQKIEDVNNQSQKILSKIQRANKQRQKQLLENQRIMFKYADQTLKDFKKTDK